MKDFYDHLVKNETTPNGLFVLHCLHKSYAYQNYVNTLTELYRLEMHGFVAKKENEFGSSYVITTKGLHLLKESEDILIRNKRIKKNEIPFEDWQEKIIAYNNLFPKGKKEGSSVSFRTNPKELYDKFKWFFGEQPDYDWDMVFKATAEYVKPFDETSDYQYMQTSKYFIRKDDKNKNTTSTLGTMCYNIVEGNLDQVSYNYKYFGD